ncbi:CDP-alcohol phosphatidyltransferase family protein [Geobacter benzoatilyticus]|uniref:CDP-alcohol phosphatidyltransferase family protein n=1 Tax=Geobacter benzoatilyticus TaxID=2815309 RepID=A0ABX7Q5V4_9BACT|nr:CDP-alcohol phosphatidyltransferase family protein [Geobacter benzoatilyticus]QSV46813.1 CDP-alcohol phosphatidyltransferase family protein [Geobacter benzoatilyticus]
MTVHALILAEAPIRLWGLSSRQRLERILKKINITSVIDDPESVSREDSILLLRGDYLYDERLIRNLVQKSGTVLQTAAEAGSRPVAAHVAATDALLVRDVLDGKSGSAFPPSLSFETPQTLAPTYMKQLRKIDPPYLLPIVEENREKLERRLFSGSYKGVTDLVTKWLWPRPAQVVTRFCANRGITPNMVTSVSLVLVIIAGFLFYHGHFALGLAAAWGMTFLDTVDGKLARVTVNSSYFGHIFDHAIDLISPPFWYLVWGFGLASWNPGMSLSMVDAFWLIFIGYIAGRMVEGIFKKCLEPSGIFCWRPIDSYFRLITGRRNPNLILLTLGLIAGRPDLGLVAVALWTVISSIFLVVRLATGFALRIVKGPLQSWFLDIDPDEKNPTLAQRCFSNNRV